MTLMILIALVVSQIVNRKAKIPAARFFGIGMAILFLLTITNSISLWSQGGPGSQFISDDIRVLVRVRNINEAIGYILLPLVIMTEVFITCPRGARKYRPLLAIPAVANAVIYATAFWGSKTAFWINNLNHFQRGPLGYTIFFALLFYVFLLALFSIIYFRSENGSRSAIVFMIVIQSVVVVILEQANVITGYAYTITALCMLEYYFYLSVIYQQEMHETITEKELSITQQRMTILRNQIQPHFIFNSLSVIRSLAKKDSAKAVSCIDNFSDYLKAHVYVIQDDDMVSFEKELVNVRAYLALAQADSRKDIEVIYDLQVTNFEIPPLSLEPIVENAIKHGIGQNGGTITVSTRETDGNIIIEVENTGTPDGGLTEQQSERLGIGIANTRSRLEMQCKGTLDIDVHEDGAIVTITLPRPQEV